MCICFWQLPGVTSNSGHFELYSWLKVQVTCRIYLDQKMYCQGHYTFSGGNSTILLPTNAKLGFRFLWYLIPCDFLFFHLLYIEGITHWSPTFLKRFITVSNWYWSLISWPPNMVLSLGSGKKLKRSWCWCYLITSVFAFTVFDHVGLAIQSQRWFLTVYIGRIIENI